MDLRFYFDTAVLGPEYEGGHRHLVLSVSAAWEANSPPNDGSPEQALLQPWRWDETQCEFKLYRIQGNVLTEVADAELERIGLRGDWAPDENAVAPARGKLLALYDICAKTESEQQNPHHKFRLGLEQDEKDEDPDLPNRQCWPDLLASAGRWPGLLPYRLKLQYAFRVRKEKIDPKTFYFIVPVEISTEAANDTIVKKAEPKYERPGEASVEYHWKKDTGKTGIAEARLGGSAMPSADEASGGLLDLDSLWVRPDANGGWTSHDWFAAVPGLVAEAFDQPDLLFDVLAELAAGPATAEIPSALEKLFQDESKRTTLLEFVVNAWRQRYGDQQRRGSDGNHPLLSVLSATLKDDYSSEQMRSLPEKIKIKWPGSPQEVMTELSKDISGLAAAENGKLELALPFFREGGDSLSKRRGLDFLREATRTFAWMVSDAGLFALYRQPWVDAVATVSTKKKPFADKLKEWLGKEERDAFPLAALVRESWVTSKASDDAASDSPLRDAVTALHARMTQDKTSEVDHAKDNLVDLLSRVFDDPSPARPVLPANVPLRDGLHALGLASDPNLKGVKDAFVVKFRERIAALARRHLDGDARPTRPDLNNYPKAFGDPWPIDRVHDLMFPIDRPGHVDSDDDEDQDLRRQVAGIGLLVRQAGKPWQCLASASILTGSGDAQNYSALQGLPSAFAGDLRTTMVAYRGEPWFERSGNEALAIGYEGTSDGEAVLAEVHATPHLKVKFPDLKFGQRYYCAPFLIGPGNALPKELCDTSAGTDVHPANPRGALFSDGIPDGEFKDVSAGPYHYLRRVPVGAPLLEPNDSGTLFSRREDVHPLAHEVLSKLQEDGSRALPQEPLTLLCSPSSLWIRDQEKKRFHLRPPEVDMMVWLRHWRAMIAAEKNKDTKDEWSKQLTNVLGDWMAQADAIAGNPQNAKPLPKFHDPAHDAYLIKVEEVWPSAGQTIEPRIYPIKRIKPEGAAVDGPASKIESMFVDIVTTDKDAQALEITINGSHITVSGLQSRRVYRISVAALVKAKRFAEYGDAEQDVQGKKVFAPAALFEPAANTEVAPGYVRFSSTTLLAEVATEKLPDAEALEKALHPAFDGRALTAAADFSASGSDDWPYVRALILERQRWAWNGRHVDREMVDKLVPVNVPGEQIAGFHPDSLKADTFEGWCFTNGSGDKRSDDDHVREFAASAANDSRTLLWREDLQSRRVAEYHRFRLRARSRYAGLMDKGKPETAMTQWKPYALKFRPGAAALPRPKIAMLLPLTGGYEEHEEAREKKLHKLACLVQLDESAFEEAGLPELIEVEVDMAGPDPILIKNRPDSDTTLKCVMHGPIGHSFDPEMPDAKYRRASWVASFERPDAGTEIAAAALRDPWSLVKLKIRRKVPKAWVWPAAQADLVSDWVSAGWIQLPRPSDQILLQGEHKPMAASALRLRRVASGIAIVHADTGKPVVPEREPGFDGLFPVLTYQAIDARGIPGAERLLRLASPGLHSAAEAPIRVPDEELKRAPIGTLRLRLLTVQYNRRDKNPADCDSLAALFSRVGKTESSDASFRLMRVSLPIIEG